MISDEHEDPAGLRKCAGDLGERQRTEQGDDAARGPDHEHGERSR